MMKINKLNIFLLAICFITYSQTIPPGAPLVNTIQSQGVFGLDFSQPGNNEQLAYFLINSNSSTGFIVRISLANRGNFRNGSSVIPMTSLVLNRSSGTLGSGLVEPNNLDVLAAVSGGSQFTWNPGSSPGTETTNYLVELKANWADPSGMLAGFYFETIDITISVGP
jgi:hypothetical protein